MEINTEKLLFDNTTLIRIDDVNFANHLDASRFSGMLHNVRALFLKKHNLSEIDCFGVGLIMLNLEITYQGQGFFDDTLHFKLYLESLEKSKISFSYRVSNELTGKPIATAIAVMIFFNMEKQKPTKPPKEFLDLLETISV